LAIGSISNNFYQLKNACWILKMEENHYWPRTEKGDCVQTWA
jgi:hypothetical protein